MVNYGYSCSDWTEEQMQELANALIPLCQENKDTFEMCPYIEVNGLYDGVRIRRITHLPNNDNMQFEKKCDKIYLKFAKKFGKEKK